MAAGDTIAGQIRVVKARTLGDEVVVAGPFAQSRVDHKADPQYQLFINVPREAVPIGGTIAYAPSATFEAGEVMHVQHKATTLAEAMSSHDADEIFVDLIEEDLNTGQKKPRQLSVADNEVSADVTSSTTSFVSIFTDTVPDRRRWYLAGAFNVAGTEAA